MLKKPVLFHEGLGSGIPNKLLVNRDPESDNY